MPTAAMAATLAMMFVLGLSINMISLFALIITLGIIVDDAIVVGEHADYRHRTLGEPPLIAAENAARRMAKPVFTATVTTVIAFFALTVIGGRFGSLITSIPYTVVVVLIASLIECFLVLPNHMAHALASSAKERWYDWPSKQVNRGFEWVRERLFRPLMRLVIAARYPVVAGAVVLLTMQAALFVSGEVRWRFFNAPERGSISGNFAMLPGATREDSIAMVRELQRATEVTAARLAEEHGRNPIDYVVGEIGGNTGRSLSGADTKDTDQLGSIAIELIDADLRPYSSFDFIAELRDEVQSPPLLETLSFRGWRSGPGGDALSVQLFGASSDTLKAAAEALKTRVSRHPEVSAVEDSLAYDKEELSLDLTPQGAALGFNIDDIGRVLRNRVGGIEAATYPDGPRSASVRVERDPGELRADFLDTMLLRSPTGTYLPLADLVEVTSRQGFTTIRRENGLRVVTVSGDISEDNPERATEITRELSEEILPALESEFGVGTRLSGLAEQEREFLTDAAVGFGLCLLGIYLALAWVFSSWTRPIVVMAIIPFGLIGTVYGHWVWGVPLSMFSVIGIVGMTGIIINDSIVLVTTIDEKAQNRGLFQAIVDGTVDRLRPVILTTATTVIGLTPLLYEGSQQAQFLKPTVITLVYGLGFGMFLVLLIVPAIMAMQLDVARQTQSFRRALRVGARSKGLAAVALAGVLGVALLFSATLGSVIVSGSLPGLLSGVPMAAGQPTSTALLLFIMGTAAWSLVLYAAAAGLRARRLV